ncbi:MAG: divalent-cation tolerance protein CutA [Candidatus Phaeomarinobacter sp.]
MPDQDSTVFVYTTAPSLDAAETIARAVIGAGEAACANLLPDMRSLYMWEGSLQQESEVAMLFKTRAGRHKAAMETIARVHSYDTPAITAFGALDVDPRFAAWVAAETPHKK